MSAYKLLTTAHFACLFKHIAMGPMDITKLKAILPVAGVCKQWRDAALSEVYKTVYVDNSTGLFMHSSYDQKADLYDKSNLKIVLSNGCSHLVQKWVLQISNFNILKNLIKAGSTIGNGQNDWSSATSLEVVLEYTPASLDNNYMLFSDSLSLLKAFLPELCDVKLFYHDLHYVKPIVFNDLLSSSLDTLERLSIGMNTCLGKNLSFSNITSLSMIPYKISKPFISALNLQILKSLTLYNIPSYFNWMVFPFGKENNYTVELSSLNSLKLSYLSRDSYYIHKPANKISKKLKMVYPALQNVIISKTQQFDDVHVTHEFPAVMQSIVLSGSIELMGWLADKKITSCKELLLNYKYLNDFHYSEYDTPHYSNTLDTLFGSSSKFASVTAFTNIPRASLKQPDIHWPNLRFLDMRNEISYTNLVSFIRRLPDLLVLQANHVTFPYRPYYKNANRTKRLQQYLKPIDSKLKSLKIRNACLDTNVDYDVWCLDRLLLRLVNLRNFISDSHTIKAMAGYDTLFKDLYPHAEFLLLGSHSGFYINGYPDGIYKY